MGDEKRLTWIALPPADDTTREFREWLTAVILAAFVPRRAVPPHTVEPAT